ncbi:hypothetical protein O5552_13440 [Escherichia coli]|nr:hypothetical protein [Escherichia coli]
MTYRCLYDHGNGQQNRDNESVRGVRLTDKNNVTLAGGGLYVTVGDPGSYAVTYHLGTRHLRQGADLRYPG